MAVLKHAAVVVGAYAALFTWLFARPLVEGAYLAGTDLYDYHLPIFLAPITIWSTYELSGLPAFADSQNAAFYPLMLLFGRLLPSWTAFIVSAYVLAASCTYAYVYNRTGSRIGAAAAGLAYGLSEAMVERVEHLAIVHTIAWLPLIALAVDRLRGRWDSRWVVVGAVAVGSSLLAGHTQPAIYIMVVCGLYALAEGLAARAGLTYYAAVFALFAAGGLLASVSLLPLLEASREAVRQAVSIGQFVSYSNSPAQMLSAFVPSIAHEGREAPTYVGLATLVFALVALRDVRRHWPVVFWWAVAVVAGMAGAGEATPVAGALYDLPFFDRFRVIARVLVLAAFAVAVLAGFGIAAIAQRRASRVTVCVATVAIIGALLATTGAVVRWPDAFALDSPGATALTDQLLVGIATAALCLAFAWRPLARPLAAGLLVLIAVDLVHALPHRVQLGGLEAPVLPAAAVEPSVHAQELRRLLSPQHQRALAPAGVTVDPVIPAAYARLWRIPIAGAYGAIMTSRYAALAKMGTTGGVEPQALADDNTALDLLAVRYVLMREDELHAAERFEQDGMPWASASLDLPVGPDECGQTYPRSASYAIPPHVEVSRVLIVSALRCSDDVIQGTEVATLTVTGADGQRHTAALRAGIDVAEASLANEAARQRTRHAPARVFEIEPDRAAYLTIVDLPKPVAGAELHFLVHGTPGWLELRRLTVIDASGAAVPVSRGELLVSSRSRWRVVKTIATSRLSDRGADRDAPGEERIVLIENRRAMPRAWLTREVLPLDERDMLTAIHYSHLPDGRRFDPSRTALVDAGAAGAAAYEPGAADVRTEVVEDGLVQVRVSTATGGFLVLSESYYPGWQARVGENAVPILRTNLALQGIVVPAGDHLVTFEFSPASFRAGAALSGAMVVALFALCVGPRARRAAPMPQAISSTSPAT